MTSGASWNDRGLSPELYDAAREAARRAGVSVEEWLDSTFGAQTLHAESPGAKSTPRGAPLTDTVARLNARLEQLSAGHAPAETRAEPVARDRAPSIAPEPIEPNIDQVLAEISAST